MQDCGGMWFLIHVFFLASLNYLQQRQKTNYNLFYDMTQHLFMINLVTSTSYRNGIKA